MRSSGRVHDRAILDALESIGITEFDSPAWRVTRQGRDAGQGSTANGRWSPPGEFEVLYTSAERDGALAEVGYRLSLEPVWPSRIAHDIHELALKLNRSLHLADMNRLASLGVDTAKYESFDYTATQTIAAAAHFLEFDGLIVPSARHTCNNIVVFLDKLDPANEIIVRRSHPVDWTGWRKARR